MIARRLSLPGAAPRSFSENIWGECVTSFALIFLFDHDLFEKPVSTFLDHAPAGRRTTMYAAIRQAKAKTGTSEELARRIKEGAIPIISDVEGFMAYYVVYAPDDTVTAISIFNNFAGAEEANRRAIAWVEQNLEPLLAGPATAVAGPVIVHTLA
jgi:hypothetical protein